MIAALVLGALWPLTRIAEPLDRRAWDVSFAILARWREAPPATGIAIVGLDEATVASLPEPLALLHMPLGALLEALAGGGARAAALDIVLPDRSYDTLLPGADLALMRGIVAMRRAGTLLLARTVDDDGRERPIEAPLLAAAGPEGSAYALLPADGDGRVRRIDTRLGAQGGEVPTLAGELARRAGAAVNSGLIDFSRPLAIDPVSMGQVLAWARDGQGTRLRRAFEGKVVFIGALLPFVDRHAVPVSISAGRYPSAATPGVYLQAQAYRTLVEGGALPERPGIAAVLGGLGAAVAWRSVRGWRSAGWVVGGLLAALAGLALFSLAAGQAVPAAGPAVGLVFTAALRVGRQLRDDARARERLRRLFAGYVSPDVMDELEAGRLEGMSSQRRAICVMFIDVRGFTSRAEADPPERVTATLNLLFETATEVIHRHQGTVKEFMGDGVMAFFGAPRPLPNVAQAGFDAARAMLEALAGLNRALAARGEAPLALGIGLASGEAVVGHVGSVARHAYGAVGDCVNLASRLEGLTKTLGFPLLMSAAVRSAVRGADAAIGLGPQAVKGHTPLVVWGWQP